MAGLQLRWGRTRGASGKAEVSKCGKDLKCSRNSMSQEHGVEQGDGPRGECGEESHSGSSGRPWMAKLPLRPTAPISLTGVEASKKFQRLIQHCMGSKVWAQNTWDRKGGLRLQTVL